MLPKKCSKKERHESSEISPQNSQVKSYQINSMCISEFPAECKFSPPSSSAFSYRSLAIIRAIFIPRNVCFAAMRCIIVSATSISRRKLVLFLLIFGNFCPFDEESLQYSSDILRIRQQTLIFITKLIMYILNMQCRAVHKG